MGWGDWPLHECQDSHAEHPGLHVCRWQYSTEHVLHAKWTPHTLGQCPNSRVHYYFPSVSGPGRECGPRGRKANALSGLSHLFLLLLRSAVGKPRPRRRMQGCPFLFRNAEGTGDGPGRQLGPMSPNRRDIHQKSFFTKVGAWQASICGTPQLKYFFKGRLLNRDWFPIKKTNARDPLLASTAVTEERGKGMRRIRPLCFSIIESSGPRLTQQGPGLAKWIRIDRRGEAHWGGRDQGCTANLLLLFWEKNQQKCNEIFFHLFKI